MGRGRLLWAALLAVGTAGPVAAQQGTLIGTVTNESGALVQNAEVSVIGGSQPLAVLTNAQGQYRVVLAAGTYDLVVALIGSLTQRIDDVSVAAGQTATIDVVLPTRAIELNPLVVSVQPLGSTAERQTESVATIYSVNAIQIAERPQPSLSDHLRVAPGVDIITHGVQATNVVVRGFNNIFSGALHMLSDHRLAGVPSLRVNLMHFIPTTEDDVERMEVVLGPGSALYGPNTANGVVHILTKSPLDSEGTTVTLGSGEQSVLQGAFRSAWALSDQFGFKLSGQYLKGDEWPYLDATEEAARVQAETNRPACVGDRLARNLTAAQANEACDRVGRRDFDIARWSGELRADWRFSQDGAVIASYGRTDATGIELTGLGAGQTGNWVYQFFQTRANWRRLFAQAYYNTSSAGDTYLLRSGTALVDESTLLVGQVQHGLALADGRQDFTYGVDYYRTRPQTQGTINGSYENADDIDEWGVYLQSKTALTEQLDLIFAGRIDDHSLLADKVFSPRAGLVFRPVEGHSFRLSYNRAFSTPSSLNYFLDISGGLAPAPLSTLGYTVRAFGTGKNGWTLQPGGANSIRSHCPTTPSAPWPVPDASVLWPCMTGMLRQAGAINAGTEAFLNANAPTSAAVPWKFLDTNTGANVPMIGTTLPAVEPIQESYTESFELGWTGVFSNVLSVSADVYYMQKNDFVSPLIVQTPLIMYDSLGLVTHLTPLVGGPTAVALGSAMAEIPLGVLAAAGIGPNTSPDLIATYRNIGDVELWGGDVTMQWFLNDDWSISGTMSAVSDDYFHPDQGAPIALNSPELKGSLGAAYRNVRAGLTGGARWRFQSEFPAESAGYVGTRCVGGVGPFVEDCVEARLWGFKGFGGGNGRPLVDLNFGYEVPTTDATLQLVASNILDAGYRSFVGVPRIGRFAMISLRYDLF
jgi:iron complex outermembrane receptor protein